MILNPRRQRQTPGLSIFLLGYAPEVTKKGNGSYIQVPRSPLIPMSRDSCAGAQPKVSPCFDGRLGEVGCMSLCIYVYMRIYIYIYICTAMLVLGTPINGPNP